MPTKSFERFRDDFIPIESRALLNFKCVIFTRHIYHAVDAKDIVGPIRSQFRFIEDAIETLSSDSEIFPVTGESDIQMNRGYIFVWIILNSVFHNTPFPSSLVMLLHRVLAK